MFSSRILLFIALAASVFVLSYWGRRLPGGHSPRIATALSILLTFVLVAMVFVPTIFRPREIVAAPPDAVRNWVETNLVVVPEVETARATLALPLLGAAGERRLVMVGENSHLADEFGRLKVELLRQLHADGRLACIVLEASTIGCHLLEQELSRTEGEGDGLSRLPPLLQTRHVVDLLAFVRSTYDTDTPVRLFGCDIQLYQEDYLPLGQVLADLLGPIDPDLAAAVAERIPDYVKHLQPWRSEGKDAAVAAVAADIEEHYRRSRQVDGEQLDPPGKYDLFLSRAILRNAAYLSRMQQSDYVGGYTLREHGMAENVRRLRAELGRDAGIFVWAHNDHVSKSCAGRGLVGTGTSEAMQQLRQMFQVESMGAILDRTMPGEVYAVGMFAATGKLGPGPDGNTYAVRDLRADSLEFLTRAEDAFATGLIFDPVSRPNDGVMHEHAVAQLRNGVTWYRSILAAEYDAVIVVQEVSPIDIVSP